MESGEERVRLAERYAAQMARSRAAEDIRRRKKRRVRFVVVWVVMLLLIVFLVCRMTEGRP